MDNPGDSKLSAGDSTGFGATEPLKDFVGGFGSFAGGSGPQESTTDAGTPPAFLYNQRSRRNHGQRSAGGARSRQRPRRTAPAKAKVVCLTLPATVEVREDGRDTHWLRALAPCRQVLKNQAVAALGLSRLVARPNTDAHRWRHLAIEAELPLEHAQQGRVDPAPVAPAPF